MTIKKQSLRQTKQSKPALDVQALVREIEERRTRIRPQTFRRKPKSES